MLNNRRVALVDSSLSGVTKTKPETTSASLRITLSTAGKASRVADSFVALTTRLIRLRVAVCVLVVNVGGGAAPESDEGGGNGEEVVEGGVGTCGSLVDGEPISVVVAAEAGAHVVDFDVSVELEVSLEVASCEVAEDVDVDIAVVVEESDVKGAPDD